MKALKVKKGDIVILAAVLCIAAIAFLCISFLPHGGTVAAVEVNGNTVATLPLSEDTSYDVVFGGEVQNTVQVKDGKVSVTFATCPDKICVHHRAIDKTGESIICLPHKVIVTVQGDGQEVDGEVR